MLCLNNKKYQKVDPILKLNASSFLKDNKFNPIIKSKYIDKFINDNKCSLEQCLLAFSYASASLALHVPISNYKVGAVVRGSSGNVYCGANSEFIGVSLNTCIHGEQSATHNAFYNGEREITHLAVNAPPCGYCRQFLNELSNANKLIILIENETSPEEEIISKTLQDGFLPYSFGPKDLGNKTGMLDSEPFNLSFESTVSVSDLAQKTLKYVNLSYAPYSLLPSAVGISFIDNSYFFGIYLENAAYNPSLNSMVAALNLSIINGKNLNNINGICLLEAKLQKDNQKDVSSLTETQNLIKSIGITSQLEFIKL